MKRTTRGFVSGFSVAILATGAWGVFGSGGAGLMMVPVGEFGDVGERVVEEMFIPLGLIGDERIEAGEEMEVGRQDFRRGKEDEALTRMGEVIELAPENVEFRIEYAQFLQERGERLFRGGRRAEGAVLLENASYQAQAALGRCLDEGAREREIADCYLLLGDLSFDPGRDAQSAAMLYRNAVVADAQNPVARERLADALLVLDRRGERRVTGTVSR